MNIGFFFFFFLVNALCQNSLLLYFSQWGTKRFYQAKQGVLEKVILFPLSYFSYTLKGSTILFLKWLNKILFMDCLWVQEVPSWPIFYLQMAAFYSTNLHLRNVRKCWISWGFMRGVQLNRLIEIRLLSSSVNSTSENQRTQIKEALRVT